MANYFYVACGSAVASTDVVKSRVAELPSATQHAHPIFYQKWGRRSEVIVPASVESSHV